MKNIAIIAIFTLLLGQFGWAQDSKTTEGRRSLRKSGKSGSVDPGESGAQPKVGSSSGRSESGRPEPSAGKKGRVDLYQIIKKELKLTEEQEKRLRKIRTEYHHAVKTIKGGKEFSELTAGQKEKLSKAWIKFKTARAKILSKKQLAQLLAILHKHRKVDSGGKSEGGKREGGESEGGKREGGHSVGKGGGGSEKGKKGGVGKVKPFPKHWGEPPAIQTRDYVKLPGGYGFGSSTLARWIEENMKSDARKRR